MKHLFLVCFLVLVSSVCHADTLTGMIDTCSVSGIGVSISIDSVSLSSTNEFLQTTLLYAYRHNQEIYIDYTGSSINSVSIVDPSVKTVFSSI